MMEGAGCGETSSSHQQQGGGCVGGGGGSRTVAAKEAAADRGARGDTPYQRRRTFFEHGGLAACLPMRVDVFGDPPRAD